MLNVKFDYHYMQTRKTTSFPEPYLIRPAVQPVADRVVVLDMEEGPFLNPHTGDDTRWLRAHLEGGEAAEALLPSLLAQRSAQYAPAAHDDSERLSCLAGMAATRLDVHQAEQAFRLLEGRFLSATMPAERVLLLEAMYHACGYESRLFLMELKRRCDHLFDEAVPADLATPRLLFYRYCPSPVERTISRSAACGRWLQTLQTWMTEQESHPETCWGSLPLSVKFRRLRYLWRTGCKHLSGGDAAKADIYRHLLIDCFLDTLSAFRRHDSSDVQTLVSAYEALREFRFDVKAHERHYRPLMAKVATAQSALPADSPSWLRLEELRHDYAATQTYLPVRLLVS